ncbi:hypothetical protein AB0J86_27885 [Micromonospora sp. NPDC049559]|uniref:hypothetical protein n=1 Tax=Micromonospora sp. NPDC049559 TaxID=3155923 RepID=UPI0034486006
MRRPALFGSLAAVAALVALAGTGCATTNPDPVWVAAASADPSGAASPGGTTTPARLPKVTSACELLPAAVVVEVLGGSRSTRITATERPVQDAETQPEYTCVYGQGSREVLAFKASVLPDRADTATRTIDAIATASKAKTTRLDKLGDGAVSYVTDGYRVLAATVAYRDELRLLVFSGPSIVPQDRLVELANRVLAKV